MKKRNVKILLIEDNPEDANLIQEMLDESVEITFDLKCTDRLKSGLQFLNDNRKIDLILLNLSVPDGAGFETIVRVQARAPNAPIIVLTAFGDEHTGIGAVRTGAQDYLEKGQINSNLMLRSISYAIERQHILVELKLQSQELEESREGFHNIVEKSADGVIVIDRSGIVRFVNPIAQRLFKHKVDNLPGTVFGYPIVDGEFTEVGILRSGGNIGVAEMRVVETEWEGEKAYLTLLRDITERKQAAEQLLRQERLAAMGTLASIVGHEVRSPLGVIKNSVEFLKIKLGKSVDEKVMRHLNILQEEVDTSDKIIDDILSFARLKKIDLSTVKVDDIVEASIKRVGIPGNVEVVYKFGTDLPEINVDASQIKRVLINIISNALDAMIKGGTLTIRTREHVESEGQRFVQISFQDTGVGIPKENIDEIFKPLFTTKSKGTGLGLATCRNIVHAHDGTIELKNRPKGGTVATVTLPTNKVTDKEAKNGEKGKNLNRG